MCYQLIIHRYKIDDDKDNKDGKDNKDNREIIKKENKICEKRL